MSHPSSDDLRVPISLQSPFCATLVVAAEAWLADPGERLISLVLFGSVARRQARRTSDIDLVAVGA